mgnify:CR=1 FL=1
MDGGQLTAVLIVAIIMVASIIRAKYGYGRYGRHRRGMACMDDGGQAQVENERLRDEVSQLKERIKVLRFANHDVIHHLPAVLTRIAAACNT